MIDNRYKKPYKTPITIIIWGQNMKFYIAGIIPDRDLAIDVQDIVEVSMLGGRMRKLSRIYDKDIDKISNTSSIKTIKRNHKENIQIL
jgi:hypothetical protein